MTTMKERVTGLPVYTMLGDFVTVLGQCPVSGHSKTEQALSKFWQLGLAEGVTVGLTSAINAMISPTHEGYDQATILRQLVIPLAHDEKDLEWAHKKIEELVVATWS